MFYAITMKLFIVESYVSEEQLYSFAWRIPFFISVLGGFMAFYMRKHLLEPEDFIKAKVQENLVSNPFMVMIRTQKINFFKLATIFLTTQVSFFVVFIYGKTMMIINMKTIMETVMNIMITITTKLIMKTIMKTMMETVMKTRMD